MKIQRFWLLNQVVGSDDVHLLPGLLDASEHGVRITLKSVGFNPDADSETYDYKEKRFRLDEPKFERRYNGDVFVTGKKDDQIISCLIPHELVVHESNSRSLFMKLFNVQTMMITATVVSAAACVASTCLMIYQIFFFVPR